MSRRYQGRVAGTEPPGKMAQLVVEMPTRRD